jgi:hypothetical protein
MTENVGAQRSRNAGSPGVCTKQLPKPLPRHPGSPAGHKEIRANPAFENPRSALGAIARYRGESSSANWDKTLFVAFAGDPKNALIHVQIGDGDLYEFAHANACGIEKIEHRPISHASKSVPIR